MVQNNKVLTVSYGTFSCTLEGFEDSFGTMKAIAEYFRDLAADDRYFGAEPPQPDADMLARIAQREVARQVEARTSDEGIHLRAATPPAAPQPTHAPAPSRAPVTEHPAATRELKELPPGEVDFFVEPEDALQQAESADAPAASADAPEVYSLDGSAEEPFADDFEDEIDAPAAIADTPADDAPKTFAPGEVDFFVEPEEALAQSQPADTPETAEDAYSFDGSAEEPFADDLEDFEDVEAFEAENAPADASDTTSQADADDDVNLDQIAAIVAARAADTASDDLEEDEPADIPVAEPVAQDAPQPAQNSIAAKLQRIRAVVSRTPTDEFSEDQHADAVSSKAKQKLQDMADDSAELPTAPTASDSYEDESETLISRALEELQSATEDTPAADPAPEPAPETAQALIAEPAEDTPSKPRRARVIRVRRGGGKPAEIAAPAAPAGPPSTLSHEDEDDLRRELAAVEAELLAATRAEAEPEPQDPAPNRAPAASDGDVTRLMAAADEKLGDPDTASSRETYSHMRAAVAAAQGDPDAGVDDVEKDYREDLAQVVQPRRPVVHRKSPRSEPTPAVPRPTPVEAPLKLVAEQRVAADPAQPTAQAETAAPVRPRRVKTTPQPNAAEAFNADTGFAKYVQDTGAVELNELLEAAAAYLSFVKGQDVFSRPELLNKVRATGTEFNREDSMRSFGQLLRDGKIARRRNGRFAASDQIGFQPQDRAAG